nr:hypothetical protein Iba_chr02fCG7420 [Ipomoea batatas]
MARKTGKKFKSSQKPQPQNFTSHFLLNRRTVEKRKFREHDIEIHGFPGTVQRRLNDTVGDQCVAQLPRDSKAASRRTDERGTAMIRAASGGGEIRRGALLGLGSFGGVAWSWLIHLTACFSCLVLVALEVLDDTLDSFEELRNVLMVK